MKDVILEAIHYGVLQLGSFELPCYVLTNEKRVLAQNKVVHLISGGRDSGDLGRYLRAKNIQRFLPDKFKGAYQKNIFKFMAGNQLAYGLEAKDVIDICNMYLSARQAGVISPNQVNIVEMSELFIRACAKVGIEALIDEATGYQDYRDSQELQNRLALHLQDEFREWTRTFPRVFFDSLYRLEGIRPPLHSRPYPKRFGVYVMRFVYDTLDPDVANYLREKNPNPQGKKHHHQLFNDFGYKRLTDHLMAVLGIMKASLTIEKCRENLLIAFPKTKMQQLRRLSEARRKVKIDSGQEEFQFTML